MNDQELNCFLSAAKYLNFTDAASHLYLSQSAFSRNIAKLEKELGVTLFYRDTKNVELTAAGIFLYTQLSKMYQDFLFCISKAQLLEKGVTGKLSLGLLENQAMEPIFQSALRRYSEDSSDVHIEMSRYSFYELVTELLSEKLDAVITLETEVNKRENLDYLIIEKLPTRLIVPSPHPLAEKTEICPKDLENETILAPTQTADQATHDAIESVFLQEGITPKHKYLASLDEQLLYLEAGQGITFINTHNLTCSSPSLKVIDVDFIPDSVMVFAYRKDHRNPALSRLIDYLKEELSLGEND